MKLTVLTEDTSGREDLRAEHGLSFYVETEKHILLADTGASGLFAENAEKLGKDLSAVDTVVISHGHYDHAGGLTAFAERNRKATVYLQKGAFGAFYHGERFVGVDPAVRALPNLRLPDGDLRIDDELYLFSGITGRRLWPEGNRELSEKREGKLVQDRFLHEQCLVIFEKGKRYLLSGCAHNGILNVLDRFSSLFSGLPDAVFSGFHMMKEGEYAGRERESIEETARLLAAMPTAFYTGHCTGAAYEILEPLMPNLRPLRTGDVFVL